MKKAKGISRYWIPEGEKRTRERGSEEARDEHPASSIKHPVSSIESGFTLVEISIVIFIMMLMLSAAVPWMRTFAESTRLRSAARRIRSLMEFARSCTVTQRTEYVVLFDANQGEYWLSLLAFLDEGSGDAIADSSRTSLSESLASLSDEDSTDLLGEDEQETEGAFSRTGGILGVPKQLPGGIDIVQISSPRSSSGDANNEVDYVTFYPDGTAEDFEIYLQSSSGRIFLLSVAEATGRTGIRELTVEEIEELGLGVSQ